MTQEEPLEVFWDEIRRRSPIRLIRNRLGIKDTLEVSCAKAGFDLLARFRKHEGKVLDKKLLHELAVDAITSFMATWRHELATSDPSGLLELVIENQVLEPDELKDFVRAVPANLLVRIANAGLGSARGVHMLVGVEAAVRSKKIEDYTIEKDMGRLRVWFTDPVAGEIDFYLDETLP